ncbi:MAG: hypothetical protein K0Q49_963 [Haloplasmataceae bacterium]|jgi:hypothetical protein|nr:hypothetical protein [Haloplasmataceae bacterium]
MIFKRIKPNIFDELIVAKLSKNKALYKELENKYKDNMYEEFDIQDDLVINSVDEIDYINILLDKGLEEYEDGIYAGIAYSNLYEFDFFDKSVTVSLNLLDHYVFLIDYKRVWFYSDLFKNAYLFVNYETGEILNYIGPDDFKDKVIKRFDDDVATKEILKFVNKNNLNELFYYIQSGLNS